MGSPPMPECPACLGDGGHDLRDTNAYLRERLTDDELAFVPNLDIDFIDCDECDSTGVVSEERARDLQAASRAVVDQVIAEYNRQQRPPEPRDFTPPI